MRYILFRHSLCLIFAFASLSYAAETWVCDDPGGTRWHQDLKIDFRSKSQGSVGPEECMPHGTKWDPWDHAPLSARPQKPVACSNIPADGRLRQVSISTKPAGYECEHVLVCGQETAECGF